MNKIDVEHLRNLTESANHENASKLAAKIIANTKKKQEIKEIQKVIAENYMSQVAEKCEKAAKEGDYSCKIMELVQGRDYSGFPSSLTIDKLQGVGKLVVEMCHKNNLTCTAEYWHDGIGIVSRFDLRVSWE